VHKIAYPAIIALLGFLALRSPTVENATPAAPVAKLDSPPVTPAKEPEITLTEDERHFIEWTRSKRMRGSLSYHFKCGWCNKASSTFIEHMRPPTSNRCGSCRWFALESRIQGYEAELWLSLPGYSESK
jgi:hypothetical protein